MDKNFNLIAKELFGKIRTQFPKVQLGDVDGKPTSTPEDARLLNFDYQYEGRALGAITVNLSEEDGLVVLYSNDIVESQSEYVKNRFFDFIKEMREFAKQRFLNFDTRDITKSNLDQRDHHFLSQNNGEAKMTESKLFGTSKTSYQELGDSKIIVKHSAPVNIENPAGRTQRIDNIYIENAVGERFRYPYKHLNGARALAQHINHGGTPYDVIGQHVIGLSEELAKLRMFKNYVERNPMVAENMGSVNNKVAERIDAVKKSIHDLQHPMKYEQFAEAFEAAEEKQIPEDLMNDWIDRLTIRTFNEELKNVFPYIFKLVDESDIPVKELAVEDLLGEEKCEVCGMDPCDCDDHEHSESREIEELAAYERMLGNIVERTDIFSDNPESQNTAIDALNKLIGEPFPVGIDGDNAIEGLADIIDDEELMDIFKELADLSPDSDVRDVLKDYIKMKDEENGTDVLSKLNFGSDEEDGMDGTPEVPAAEPAPAEPAPAAAAPAEPAPAEQPVTASVDNDKDDLPFDPDPRPSKKVTPGKHGQEYSKARHLARQGLKAAIEKARKAGATAETIINIAGRDMTLGEVMEMANLQEDIFDNKSEELIEFVKSMYNTEEGSFPKGETGVLIACEKKFGEAAVPMAKQVIEKLHSLSEMNRMKKLAGLAH